MQRCRTNSGQNLVNTHQHRNLRYPRRHLCRHCQVSVLGYQYNDKQQTEKSNELGYPP